MIVFVDGTERRVVESPLSRNSGTLPSVYTGEKITLDVVPLKEIERGSEPAYELDDSYDSNTFKVGIGVVDRAPDSGTFKITYKTDTSAALDFDSTATEIQTALNDASMTDLLTDSPSGVVVTGDRQNGWRILFAADGSKDDFGSDDVNLIPESSVIFTTERAGGSGVQESVSLRLHTNQAALTTSASSIPYGTTTATEIIAGSGASREITDIGCIDSTAPIAQKEEFKAVDVGGSDAVTGVYRLDVVADSSGSLDGTYFTLYDAVGSVAFWFDHDGNDSSPPAGAISADRSVRITSLSNDSDIVEVASAVETAISGDSQFNADAEPQGDRVVVTYATSGDHGSAAAGTSGFTVSTATAGVDGSSTDNYDGTYFYHSVKETDGSESIYGYYFSRVAGQTEPPTAAMALDSDLTEISGYSVSDSALDMASLIASSITANTGVTSVASGTEVKITQDRGGDVADANAGDSPLTNFSVTTNGADNPLDGKHFLIYETDGQGSEQSRAVWFNISGNGSPSGTALTADVTTEVTTVLDGDLAYEVAEKLSVVLNGLSTFSASQKGAKVRAVSSTGFAFTNATAETSGFSISVIQAGGTGSDANEVVEISFSDQAIGGVFILGINIGNGVQYTEGIAWNANEDQIEDAISALSGITPSDITAEGGNGGDIRITFSGNLANTAITVTVDDSAIIWIQGKRFTLDLNTTTAAALVLGQDEVAATLEVEATQGSDYTVKLVHDSITLKNGLIDSASASPTPVVDFYTSTEVDALVIHHEKALSSLTGGSASDLDSIDTTSITTERAVFFYDADNSEYVIYVLKAGTEAESSPDIIRPDDFAASTNEKYWKRVDFNDPDSSVLLTNGSRAGTGIQEFLGLNLTDSNTLTLSSGSAARAQGYHTIAAESGTSDNLTSLTGASEGDLLLLQADTGDTITIEHNTGADQFHLTAEANLAISGNDVVAFVYNGTLWCEIGNAAGSGSGDVVYRSDITGLIGGTSSDLDSLDTASLDVGSLYQINAGGCMLTYELVSQAINTEQTITGINTSTDRFSVSPNHELVGGQRVMIASDTTMPGGVSDSTVYFVKVFSASTFGLATTLDGSTVDVTTTGSGTITYRVLDTPFFVEPTDYAASTNEKHWKLVAPFRNIYFEAVGPETDLDEATYSLFRANEWLLLKGMSNEMQSLPTGSGSSDPEWRLEVDADTGPMTIERLFATGTQSSLLQDSGTLDYPLGSDVGNATILPKGRKLQLQVTDAGDNSGAAVTGQGAIICIKALYSHIGE